MSLKPYKIQVVQKLEQFAAWFINQCELNPNFTEKIIMSDEAHFHINGSVNKRKCLAVNGRHLKYACNIKKLSQVNKPQDFSFQLVYQEFVISKFFISIICFLFIQI